MPEQIENKVNVIEVPVMTEPDVVVEERVIVESDAARRTEPPVVNWESTLHKGIRSKEGEPVGNVMALYPDSIHIETEGSKAGYDVPKTEVAGFDGAEVRLNVPIADMAQFLEHK
ncbi:MAG: hypothetical protein ABI347_12010 [Nitrososphaera sp.]|jgi:hypothetical protein